MCCSNIACLGYPPDCYCDLICFYLNDCCSDAHEICTFGILYALQSYTYPLVEIPHFKQEETDTYIYTRFFPLQ